MVNQLLVKTHVTDAVVLNLLFLLAVLKKLSQHNYHPSTASHIEHDYAHDRQVYTKDDYQRSVLLAVRVSKADEILFRVEKQKFHKQYEIVVAVLPVLHLELQVAEKRELLLHNVQISLTRSLSKWGHRTVR